MQSKSDHDVYVPIRGLKQVKVDNWGTFFLQRLLQLYFNEELLDINIKFPTSNNILKVHKLVIASCTDYFLQLEREQNETNPSNSNDIVMPSDMPYECVKSIISFMYTGQLEYWTSEQNSLYRTAQKMNMTVITKLLDAQLNTNSQENLPSENSHNKTSILKSKDSLTNRKSSSTVSTPTQPTKKLPVWKRKLDDQATPIDTSLETYHFQHELKHSLEHTSGPSRFDLPEVEDLTLGVFSSFDDITYNTKPILQAPEKLNKRLNIKLSNDKTSDTYSSFNNNSNCIKMHEQKDNSDDEWIGSESYLQLESIQSSPLKKIRFDLNDKENLKKSDNNCLVPSTITSADSTHNHAKIIREVLKKYPHLVQNNKNIRLRIMQKESKSSQYSTTGKTKVSYLVLKSDSLVMNNTDNLDSTKSTTNCELDNNEIGPWKCTKCNLDEQYASYNMYRRHMQDVHNERFDPRICEHCGYKATKRNILMYHMYTKHNIPPPKNMSFPKCQICSYVALSESLLTRHEMNHKHQSTLNLQRFVTDLFQCTECEKNFTNVTELNLHQTITGHETSSDKKEKNHYCLYCDKNFMKVSDLKNHIDHYHKNMQRFEHFSDIPASLKSTSEVRHHITNDETTTINLIDELQPCEDNTNNFTKSPISKVENDSNKLKNQQIVIPMNNEDYQCQTLKDDYSLRASINDDTITQKSDGNIVVYIQKVMNDTFSQEYNINATYDNYQYSLNNHDIVEEVVEELEAIEDEKNEEDSGHKNLDNTQIMLEDEKNYNSIEKFCMPRHMNTDSQNIEKVIQYVEEETEILEYET